MPQGAASVEVEFQFLSPQDRRQGRVVMTPEMLNLQWNTVTLYPAGYYTRQINDRSQRHLAGRLAVRHRAGGGLERRRHE